MGHTVKDTLGILLFGRRNWGLKLARKEGQDHSSQDLDGLNSALSIPSAFRPLLPVAANLLREISTAILAHLMAMNLNGPQIPANEVRTTIFAHVGP
ncbi:unnamed protein product [Lasius platythorax]|uniref:Uncharacterized protein n=1 Tax=Lasius platythorax TaxID=488582 RepID=A0AAV2NPM5_9HYME